jgi:hypothetical protein
VYLKCALSYLLFDCHIRQNLFGRLNFKCQLSEFIYNRVLVRVVAISTVLPSISPHNPKPPFFFGWREAARVLRRSFMAQLHPSPISPKLLHNLKGGWELSRIIVQFFCWFSTPLSLNIRRLTVVTVTYCTETDNNEAASFIYLFLHLDIFQ